MTKHYFSNNDDLKHARKYLNFVLRGNEFKFISDAGVFSKNAVDFGSRVLIEAFQLNKTTGRILDVGCGYGPIGLAIAKSFPEATIDMVDVNLRALELAKENAALNHIQNVQIFESSVYENVSKTDYQAILSNPPIRAGKKLVHAILEEAHGYLADFGELWIVIQKKQGGPSAAKKMEEVFGNVETVVKEKGYFIFKSTK
ncbi:MULTISPECIES: class I SAM-dependent methyltransferase [unclassified Listeria]|uniref:class I SAM-dependent methyltransferase n=1 Tax=unclassified Listeria TaxID=2642072 RepID=UPI000B58D32B|nr:MULTISPECIES: class I SAM-dependent methyltransferase [unclassified Listeria]